MWKIDLLLGTCTITCITKLTDPVMFRLMCTSSVAMLVNSSELRAADFHLAQVRPLQLDAVAHGGRRTRCAAVRKRQGAGNSTFVLSVQNDNDFRSRCE